MTTKRRIVDDEPYAHFVTFTCHQRRRLLDYDHPKRIVLGVLNHQLSKMSAKCVGFVIMPDHIHAIIWHHLALLTWTTDAVHARLETDEQLSHS